MEKKKKSWWGSWWFPLILFLLGLIVTTISTNIEATRQGGQIIHLSSYMNLGVILFVVGFIWLIVRIVIGFWSTVIKKGTEHLTENEYFTCKICGKEFYKDNQIERGVCKNCYERDTKSL